MNHLRLCQAAILVVLYAGASSTAGQQSAKPNHSWDVLMNSSGAKEAASKLIGHCGNAETQDVMNACFAMEFKDADKEMNSVYQTVLSRLEREDRERVRVAQRAWLRYRDLHCEAVGSVQAGGGSLEPTEVYGCKADLTKARTKEVQNAYKSQERLGAVCPRLLSSTGRPTGIAQYRIERFGELTFDVDVFVDGEIGTLFRFVEVAGSPRHDDDGDLRCFGLALKLGDQFASRHLWHLHVGNDQGWPHACKDFESFHTIGGRLHGEAAFFEKAAHRKTDQHGVVND
jgi:uncharacterized protein YecT (DUF1311 family)